MTPPAYPDPARRFIIMASALMGATMVVIDSTIAGVALPHMQSTTGASQEQIMWVLTSYMIATAIATPLSSWLAGRYGRKLVMLVSVVGFTVASVLCGAANSLEMLVAARVLQGISGAGLQPLGQAAIMDVTPPDRQARALAIFSMGSMLGPLFGPTLGGWLTDSLSWRWVFFINLPIGVLTFIGLWGFMPEARDRARSRFDMFGFATVSLLLASFQLMVDRGEQLDWFDSNEIRFYAVMLGLCLYLLVVHMLTAKDTFIRPGLFRDRNFTVGCLVCALLGVASFGSQPLVTLMQQQLLGYTAFHTGTLTALSSLSSLLAVIVVTRSFGQSGERFIVMMGLFLLGVSQFMFAALDLFADERAVLLAGLVKGAGVGLTFTLLPGMVFATLKPEYRNEGASIYALLRSIGTSIGISGLQIFAQHSAAATRTRLAEGVRSDNPVVQHGMPDLDLSSIQAMARMAREVFRQAIMVGYVSAFWLAGVIAMAIIPLVLLLRPASRSLALRERQQAPVPDAH